VSGATDGTETTTPLSVCDTISGLLFGSASRYALVTLPLIAGRASFWFSG